MIFRKIRTKYVWIALAAFLLGIVLLWGGILAYHVVTLNQDAHQLMDVVQADNVDIAAVNPGLKIIITDLESIKSDLNPLFPILNSLSGLPAVGPLMSQAEPLLNYSQGLARSGSILLAAFEPVLSPKSQPGNLTTTQRLFDAIQSNQDAFDQAQQILDQIAPERQKIQASLLPDSIQKYYARFDPLFPVLQKGLPALKMLPALMGANGTMNYLILAQNRDEMRATGGFISGIGLASFNQGKLTSFSIGDSYAVDNFKEVTYPTPPAPLKQFMLADYWVPRDANWSPDYPTAAQEVQALYTLSTKTQVQGVISFDQLAVKGVLQALGPVTIPDYPDPISASNVEQFMIQSWSPDLTTTTIDAWWPKRKLFMGELGKVIIARFFALSDQKTLVSLALTAVDLVKSGHLLIYVNQPDFSAMLAAAHLDGSISPADGDYLYLVDSNIGFNKVDTVINRQLSYQVDLTNPQAPQAQVTTSYQHTIEQDVACKNQASYGNGTYADLQNRCYWDYWRIYMPSGSQLISSSVAPVPAAELLYGKDWPAQVLTEAGENGTQVFAGLMVLPTHSQQQNSITIALPPSVLHQDSAQGWLYNLLIQKQPGLSNLPVTVKIKLPDNAVILPGYSDWTKEGSNTWTWTGTLTGTRQLSLAFSTKG
jgi:hypothetical protein